MEKVFKANDRFGVEVDFELLNPTMATEIEGERQFKIAYSKALAEGIFPREKLRQVMSQHNMWTEEDSNNYNNIVAKLAVLQLQLDKAEKSGQEDKCKEFAKEMSIEREKMWKLFLIQQSVFTNSAEGLAELIKTEAIMAACTVYKGTKKRYWKNYTEFVQERDENEKSTAYINLISLQNKVLDELRQQIEDKYPESKYLDANKKIVERALAEEVQKEIATRKEEAIGQSGNQIDQTGTSAQATPQS